MMWEADLGARPKKRFRTTKRARTGDRVAQDVLQRRFEVAAPDRVWVSDITYVATTEGWLYPCVVLDLYARRVVGWSMSSRLGVELALHAFVMAFMARKPPRSLLFHSDRGVQYTSHAFAHALERRGIRQGMSRKGKLLRQRLRRGVLQVSEDRGTNRKFFRTRREAKAAIFQ